MQAADKRAVVRQNFEAFLELPSYDYYGSLPPKHIHYQQLDYLTEDGELIVNFFGRFENLIRDFAEVCDRIGAAPVLPHWGETKPVDYRAYYTPALRDLVAYRHRDDIAAFGYEF